MPRTGFLGISAKLSLLSLTFAIPTAWLLWLLIGAQQIAIDFAAREVAGARALGALLPVQAAASRATLAHQPITGLADALRDASQRIPPGLDARQATDAAIAAFGDVKAASQARGKLRDLIAQVGDHSNLILDNVLETYYLTDLVLTRMPEVMDRVTDLATAATGDARTKPPFLIAAGALSGAIDGMDASLAAAGQNSADGSVKAALHAAYQPLRGALGQFLDGISGGAGGSDAAGNLITSLTDFDGRAIAELRRLLDDRVASLEWTRRAHVAVAVLMYAASLLLVLWIMHLQVIRPMRRLAEVTARLAAGDLTVALAAVASGDEVGTLAGALAVFKDGMVRSASLTAEQAAMRVRADNEKREALTGMARTIETEAAAAMALVGARTASIATTAAAMSTSADHAEHSAQTAAAAAEQALANVRTVASAADGLATSIREIGGQVNQSSVVVGRAVIAGGESRATIEALNERVGRIGAVADMIGEIAAKTNLLALNATIEAARAGDAGKGFAVVAAEVKQLATQTAHSTAEITQHIGEVRAATGASVAAVGRIEQTIAEISTIAASIAAAIEEQGAATAEIARNVGETAAAAGEISRCVAEVSGETRKTGLGIAQIREDTARLKTMVGELTQSVIQTVRDSAA